MTALRIPLQCGCPFSMRFSTAGTCFPAALVLGLLQKLDIMLEVHEVRIHLQYSQTVRFGEDTTWLSRVTWM